MISFQFPIKVMTEIDKKLKRNYFKLVIITKYMVDK